MNERDFRSTFGWSVVAALGLGIPLALSIWFMAPRSAIEGIRGTILDKAGAQKRRVSIRCSV